jgi:hypothetical protein
VLCSVFSLRLLSSPDVYNYYLPLDHWILTLLTHDRPPTPALQEGEIDLVSG